ncbi:hypothetical protein KPC190_05244 [Klebsiella pneumoniae]|nr:hypothetical protein D0898_27485 [Klebsiella pneumoniae]MCB8849140.1 hypothetical protein [Klebsiella pneumoniae]MCB8867750.1 hypothetical protein [Klebsiella pneumoniae]MCB8871111.1 hypothetical protein [Klebsiella pneumoniae]PLJ61279.1 hypothetical protein B6J70_07825 [Klebsiella pneumoniae]
MLSQLANPVLSCKQFLAPDILPIICKFKFIQKVIKQKSMLFKRFRGAAATASSIGKFENKVFAVF